MEKKIDIVETAIAAGNFSTLAKALTAAGLIATLKGDGHSLYLPRRRGVRKNPQRLLLICSSQNQDN